MGVRKKPPKATYYSTWFITINMDCSRCLVHQAKNSGFTVQISLVIGMPVKSSPAISSRCYFFKKSYFKNKFKSSYWRSRTTNIRTESKRTIEAKYKETKIDAFLPKWIWLKEVLHARRGPGELLEFVLITTLFMFKNWRVICPDNVCLSLLSLMTTQFI